MTDPLLDYLDERLLQLLGVPRPTEDDRKQLMITRVVQEIQVDKIRSEIA